MSARWPQVEADPTVAAAIAAHNADEDAHPDLGGGGGAPTGPAGGVLSGSYPDPAFAVDMATQAELAAAASATADALAAHATGDASDAELAAAVATLAAALALKADAATAATDTELADAVDDLEALLAAHAAGDATDAELNQAVTDLTTLISAKQDASTAATDVELAAAIAAHAAGDATDAELATEVATINAALAGKQTSDSDLTALAALASTAFGRALLEKGDAAAVRSYIAAARSYTDLDPDSLSGLVAWFKADAITGLSNADPLTTWADSSGEGHDATQGTAGAKPTYRTNVLNGLPIVRFDGNDRLNTAGFTLPQPVHVFLVMRFTDGTFGTFLDGGANNTLRFMRDDTKNQPLSQYAAPAGYGPRSGSMDPTIFTEITTRWDDRASSIRRNGDHEEGGMNYNINLVSTPGGLTLGGIFDGSAAGFKGDFAEILVYNRILKASEERAVEAYLIEKYAL